MEPAHIFGHSISWSAEKVMAVSKPDGYHLAMHKSVSQDQHML